MEIVQLGQELLRQKSQPVEEVNEELLATIQDMFVTMDNSNGVGLAAPQIGENLRVFVIDVSTGNQPLHPIVFINPKIIKKSGACSSYEGCLSFPDAYTDVKRYANVMVKALDIHGKPFTIEGKDGSLLARAIQHEFDHLDGILFIDHCRSTFEANRILSEKGLSPVEEDRLLKEPEIEKELESIPSNPGETILAGGEKKSENESSEG